MKRRHFLSALASTASLTLWPKSISLASQILEETPRLVVVVLRGALDGLSAVPASGDINFKSLRGSLDLGIPSKVKGSPLKLDEIFALHPSLAFCHSLYHSKDFAAVHACSLPYQGRSHFDAQNCLENGTDSPSGSDTGWLNRVVGAMKTSQGLSISNGIPLLARGEAPFMTWSPSPTKGKPSTQQLASLLAESYKTDPILSVAFDKALNAQKIAPKKFKNTDQLPNVMGVAGKFLCQRKGPNIAMIQDNGWDTHANQNAVLAYKLSQLDNGIRTMRENIGELWNRTVIVITTEFGRTVGINGTNGTDHGTGSAVMLAGGAINGGKVHGAWPGLSVLKDNRDLLPVNDLRAVFKGILAQHFSLSKETLDEYVFPGSALVSPMPDLIRI